MSCTLSLRDQNFIMHPAGALFWREQQTLLISDLHLGKVAHFRKYGAAVPPGAGQRNFALLEQLLSHFLPIKFYFLGDLFHSYMNGDWTFFEAWARKTALPMILIAGNHDLISPLKYEALGIQVVKELEWDGFLLTHYPENRPGFFNISGHIHPSVQLRGKGRQGLRLPCFFRTGDQLILPAFGAFTGTHSLKALPGTEVYCIAEDEIIKI